MRWLNEHVTAPGLIHGDLWSGNVMLDKESVLHPTAQLLPLQVADFKHVEVLLKRSGVNTTHRCYRRSRLTTCWRTNTPLSI